MSSNFPQKYSILHGTFGLEVFRPGQEEVIDAVLSGRNVIATMPTGSGKSICYQIPAAASDRPTLVVSPLIALMRDQANRLIGLGVEAGAIHSGLQAGEHDGVMDHLQAGGIKLVYVSPERLKNRDFLNRIPKDGFSRLVVDEAHCISEWGHDFRPSYLQIGEFIDRQRIAQTLAFTATASKMVLKDIREQLPLKDAFELRMDPYRPNLEYSVHKLDTPSKKLKKTLELIKEYAPKKEDSVIIYCSTIKEAEDLTKQLVKKGLAVAFYHGKMESEARENTEESFMLGRTKVVVATKAFGMGIDKSNIRLVVHYNVPGSIQAYLQETGRAGRDQEPAHCSLLYREKDIETQRYFLDQRAPDIKFIGQVYQRLLSQRDAKGTKKIGGYFLIYMPTIYDSFNFKGHSNNTKVNAAIGILVKLGVIEKWDSYIKLNEFDAHSDIWRDAQEVSLVRGEIAQASLEQMICYTQSPNPNQRLLLEMMEQDLAS